MIAANLDSFEKAAEIARVCNKYVAWIPVNCHCGRYVVSADSVLGMESLVGHFVTLEPIVEDESKYDAFINDLMAIDGVYRDPTGDGSWEA